MKQENNLFKAISTIIIYLLLPNILLSPFLLFIDKPSNLVASILLLIVQILTTIIVIFYFKNQIKEEFKEFIKKPGIKSYFKYYFYGYIAMIISNMIINLIILDNSIAANEANNRALLSTMAIYAIPSMVLLAPICEELVFRKNFDNIFNNDFQFIIFTGVLFGSAHIISGGISLTNLLYIIPYSTLGIAFSYIYAKSKNIFNAIAFHIIHNSLTVALLIIAAI